MKTLHFDDFFDFTWDVSNKFKSLTDEYKDVSIIAKYSQAKQAIEELIGFGYDVVSIDIHEPEYEYYYDEYIVSLDSEGIWCEPFKRNGSYITDISDITYIFGDCSSAVISNCEADVIYEVSIGASEEYFEDDTVDESDYEYDEYNGYYDEEEEYDEESEHDGYTVNGEPATKEEFNEYTSKFRNVDADDEDLDDKDKRDLLSITAAYRVNGKKVDKKTYDSVMFGIENTYFKNVRDMLLDYCEFMDEMNHWRRLLSW